MKKIPSNHVFCWLGIILFVFSGMCWGSVKPADHRVQVVNVEQLPIKSIQAWNGRILVQTYEYRHRTRSYRLLLWELDLMTGEIRRVDFNTPVPVYAVATWLNRPVGIYRQKKKDVVRFLDGSMEVLATLSVEGHSPSMIHARKEHLFVSNGLEIISVNVKGKVHKRNLRDEIPFLYIESLRAIETMNGRVFLGYDAGEWYGTLVELEYTKRGLMKKTREVMPGNISSLLKGSNQSLWISTGLAHGVGESAGLYVYDGHDVKTQVEQAGIHQWGKREQVTKGTQAFSVSTTINGLAWGSTEDILLVAATAGIFRFNVNSCFKLVPLWSGDLTIEFSGIDWVSRSRPIGIAVVEDRCYVASRIAGVFEFRMKNDALDFVRQHIFPQKIGDDHPK